MEGRPLTKENTRQPNPYRTPSRESGPSGLERVREAAKQDGKLKFTALLHHVNIDLLRESYYSLKKQAAAGVDGVTWQEYGQGLEARLSDLPGRVHRGAYHAQPSRRVCDTESRWEATTIGDRGAGGQGRPARGRDGTQPDMGRGLSRLQLRIPAGARPTRCIGRAVGWNHAQESELDSRLGHDCVRSASGPFSTNSSTSGWSSLWNIGLVTSGWSA